MWSGTSDTSDTLTSYSIISLAYHIIIILISTLFKHKYLCTQPLHDELGAAGSVRASLYFYNSKEDVDSFIGKLKDVLKMFENMETVDAEAKSIF